MSDRPIDLRSDTVTRPTPAMRAAMAAAEVGDDVFGDDPTVNRLQERLAEILGKEAAIYVPSGTMSNQIAVRLHCQRGDELICESQCHIFNYEQGGAAQLSGVSTRAVEGKYGVLDVSQIAGLVRADDPHCTPTRLVCLENTHNRGGGRVQPFESVTAICKWAHGRKLGTHLDGARLFNAVVASGIEASRWAEQFDTVSICFSKGLGAPVGSALVGPRSVIQTAVRHRKAFGGGMRQAGVIAAAALYALEHHVDRLAEDHANARLFAEAIRALPGLELRPPQIDTNMVIFHVAEELGTAAQFCDELAGGGLLTHPFGPQLVRAVTHLDVSRPDIERACELLADAVRSGSPGSKDAGKRKGACA
jgi:threonine aldolase